MKIRLFFVVIFSLPSALCGCSRPETPPELHSLAGTVMQGDVPVTAGGLIFIPESSSASGQVVNAAVNPDGSFSAQTVESRSDGSVTRPGAPPGSYRVVYHPPSDGSKTGLEVELKQRVTVEAGGKNAAIIVLPPRLPEGLGEPRDD